MRRRADVKSVAHVLHRRMKKKDREKRGGGREREKKRPESFPDNVD